MNTLFPSLSWPPERRSSNGPLIGATLQKLKMKRRLKFRLEAQKKLILEHFKKGAAASSFSEYRPTSDSKKDYQTLWYSILYVPCTLKKSHSLIDQPLEWTDLSPFLLQVIALICEWPLQTTWALLLMPTWLAAVVHD